MHDRPIQHILVLGGGSAGFMAALTCKIKLPQLRVTVVRSPEIKIIGVGEGTTVVMPKHLHQYLDLDVADFYRQTNPMWKLGIKFLWGPRPYFNYTFTSQFDAQYQRLSRPTGFYCGESEDLEYAEEVSALMTHDRVFARQADGSPHVGHHLAYHLENETFVAYLERVARKEGVEIEDDTVVDVERDDHGVAGLSLKSGRRHEADFYIDCTGFASLLLGKTMGAPFRSFSNSLFCDRAVLGGWTRTADEPIRPYTTAETMDAGWAWRIEHEHTVNRGYVYSSAFISDEDAESEFRNKNPRLESTRKLEFKTGCYGDNWVGNVVAIGNAAGFVEPLEATSLTVIANDSQAVAETIKSCFGCLPPPSARDIYNRKIQKSWESIRCFLAVHYRFNTRLDTPFWRECRDKVDLGWAEQVVEYYRENGPNFLYRDFLIPLPDEFNLDGYLTMLLGQDVPYQRRFSPSDQEREIWRQVREGQRRKALAAYTVEQALAIVRDPRWQWSQDFYRNWN